MTLPGHSAAPLPLDVDDANLIELDALRAEVPELRRIAEAAEYATGPAGCVDPEDSDCEEYTDEDGNDRPEVKWCSHVETRHATFADVHVRERLEALLDELLNAVVLDMPAPRRGLAAELAERIKAGVNSIVWSLQAEVDDGDHITDGRLYRRVAGEPS